MAHAAWVPSAVACHGTKQHSTVNRIIIRFRIDETSLDFRPMGEVAGSAGRIEYRTRLSG